MQWALYIIFSLCLEANLKPEFSLSLSLFLTLSPSPSSSHIFLSLYFCLSLFLNDYLSALVNSCIAMHICFRYLTYLSASESGGSVSFMGKWGTWCHRICKHRWSVPGRWLSKDQLLRRMMIRIEATLTIPLLEDPTHFSFHWLDWQLKLFLLGYWWPLTPTDGHLEVSWRPCSPRLYLICAWLCSPGPSSSHSLPCSLLWNRAGKCPCVCGLFLLKCPSAFSPIIFIISVYMPLLQKVLSNLH